MLSTAASSSKHKYFCSDANCFLKQTNVNKWNIQIHLDSFCNLRTLQDLSANNSKCPLPTKT
eukprot:648247-Amphidinium_carterae.1